MSDDLLTILFEAIQRTLPAFDGRIVEHPRLTTIASEGWSKAPEPPETRIALQIDPFPHILLLTRLSNDAMNVRFIDSVHWWISSVRQRLTIQQRADLYAILVSDGDVSLQAVQDFHARIEADERFCRKLVFSRRPNSSPQDAADRFLDRTFFARPWAIAKTVTPRSLDPMHGVVAHFAEMSSLSSREAEAWLSILASDDDEITDLASQLLKISTGAADV